MSKRLMDQILIIDVEATCWNGPAPDDQESEIIEIGICTLDILSAERTEKRSLLIHPEKSKVSPFCTELTTLTQEQVEKGIPFERACHILKKDFFSQQRMWASYGDYDRTQFERQCRASGLPYPFGRRHLNIKSLFALLHALPHEVGLEEALSRVNLPLEGTHHRGDDDAWNIAALLSLLLQRHRQLTL